MVHLDKYCSSQLHIDQQANYSAWRRVHGLQIPLHQLQVVGWLLLAFFIGTTFAVLVPALGPSLRSPALFVLGCLFFLHCVSHFVALAIDPADYELRVRERAGIRAKPDFDRMRHSHVIENGLCHICNIRASGPQTKHCRMCNKCVERFDHHCKWLNQCVGARNYVAFLVCVVSAELAALAVFSVCVSELLIYFGNPAFVEALLHDKGGLSGADYRVAQLPLPRHYFLAVLVAQALLAFAAATCLLHLCLFHVYISVRGMTTYEYIRNDAKACSIPTTSTSSATTTPTNPAAVLSESTTSVPASFNQSTSSLPAVVAYHSSGISTYHSSSDCARNELTSDVNVLAKRSAGGATNPSAPLWSRLCGCHRSSFAVSAAPAHASKAGTPDSRIGMRGMNGARSESTIDALYSNEKLVRTRTGSEDSCRYCRRGKAFGERGAAVANGRVRLKSKCRCKGCRRSVMHRLCCSSAASSKAAADLRAFRSSAENGFAVGSGHADALNGCRRNQIKPSAVSTRFCEAGNGGGAAATVHRSSRIFIAPRRSNSLNSLPALPPPARRQIQSVSLKELNEILAYAQRPQTVNGGGATTLGVSLRHPLNSMRRQLRRKSNPQLKPTKTSNLSPIHESGLSNPSTPHLRDRLDRPRELSPLALNSRF